MGQDKLFNDSEPFYPYLRPWETSYTSSTVTHSRSKAVHLLPDDGFVTPDGKPICGAVTVTQRLIQHPDKTVTLETTVEPRPTPRKYLCVCRDDEFCGEEFETTLLNPKHTTCCPSCGRQQEPKILRTLL